MNLYAYEDRQVLRHKLTIHASDCEHCNAGKGNSDGRDRIFGTWYGPFTSLDQAVAVMRDLRKITEIHECATPASASIVPDSKREETRTSVSVVPDSKREEEEALRRLDDDGGASSASVVS